MSTISSLYLLVGKFGNATLLDFDQVCEALAMTKSWGYKLSSVGTFPVPLRKVGVKMYADIRDVAAYLDAEREEAEAEYARTHVTSVPTRRAIHVRTSAQEAFEAAARICDQQAAEWNSDQLDSEKNYAAHCAKLIRELAGRSA